MLTSAVAHPNSSGFLDIEANAASATESPDWYGISIQTARKAERDISTCSREYAIENTNGHKRGYILPIKNTLNTH
jgi:hypothetical protein